MARARGEESELNNAVGQKTPPHRAASTVYFSLDDDEDVLAARPTPLVEVRPQPGFQRHTAVHLADSLILPPWCKLPMFQCCRRENLVHLFKFLGAHSPVEQVVDVPKSHKAGLRSAWLTICVHRRWRNSRWKSLRSYPILRCMGLWSRMQTFQFLLVVAVGEVFRVYAQNRIQQLLVELSTLSFQSFMVVAVGEVFRVYVQNII